MIQIDNTLLDELFEKAKASDRKRMNYDLRTSAEDGDQRMLNAMLPGAEVPIHRHPMSNVLCLCGKKYFMILKARKLHVTYSTRQ